MTQSGYLGINFHRLIAANFIRKESIKVLKIAFAMFFISGIIFYAYSYKVKY
jgi:hypothetical protein